MSETLLATRRAHEERQARLGVGVPPKRAAEAPPVEPEPIPESTARLGPWLRRPRDIIHIDQSLPYIPDEMFPHWKRIAMEVAFKHGVKFSDMASPRRDAKAVAARYEAFWRCRNETNMSFPAIGRRFGGRDHTTVLHGIEKYERRMREGRAG